MIYVHVNIILDFPITYKYAVVLCQPECIIMSTSNIVVFLTKKMIKHSKKGEHSCKWT